MAVFSGNGSNTSPSFTFSSDTNTGMYRADANKLGFATDGNGQVFIDSSGNVGIGTSNPTEQLVLAANNTTTANNIFRFLDTDPTAVNFQSLGKIEWYSSDSDEPGVKAFIETTSYVDARGGVLELGTDGSAAGAQRIIFSRQGSSIAEFDNTSFAFGGTLPSSPNITLSASGNIEASGDINASGVVYGSSQFFSENTDGAVARTYVIEFGTSARVPYLLFFGYGTGATSTTSRYSTILGVFNPVVTGTGEWVVISKNESNPGIRGTVSATAGTNGQLTITKAAGSLAGALTMTISIVNGGDLEWQSITAS